MDLVGVWFGIIERQAIHRGTFTSVRDLTGKICTFIDGWNTRCHPFTWTKTADQILTNQPSKDIRRAALGRAQRARFAHVAEGVLTRTEQRIAELVAHGCTNAEPAVASSSRKAVERT